MWCMQMQQPIVSSNWLHFFPVQSVLFLDFIAETRMTSVRNTAVNIGKGRVWIKSSWFFRWSFFSDQPARPAGLPTEEREESWNKSHYPSLDLGLLLASMWSQVNEMDEMRLLLAKQWKNRGWYAIFLGDLSPPLHFRFSRCTWWADCVQSGKKMGLWQEEARKTVTLVLFGA